MTISEAFNELIANWKTLDVNFRNKYKASVSKFTNKQISISYEKKKAMLIQSGYVIVSETEFKSPFLITKK